MFELMAKLLDFENLTRPFSIEACKLQVLKKAVLNFQNNKQLLCKTYKI